MLKTNRWAIKNPIKLQKKSIKWLKFLIAPISSIYGFALMNLEGSTVTALLKPLENGRLGFTFFVIFLQCLVIIVKNNLLGFSRKFSVCKP